MSDTAPRLAARSVVPIADLELLRVARADLDEPGAQPGASLAERLRGLARFRAGRPDADDLGPAVRLDSPRD